MKAIANLINLFKLLQCLSVKEDGLSFEWKGSSFFLDSQGNLQISTSGYYSINSKYIFQNCPPEFITQTLKSSVDPKIKLALLKGEQCLEV